MAEAKLLTAENVSRSVFWTVARGVHAVVFAILTTVVVVRMLGSSTYGEYATAIAILTFAPILYTLVLDQALVRFVPELRVSGNTRGIRQLMRSVLAVQLGIWLLLVALAWFTRPLLNQFYSAEIGTVVFFGLLPYGLIAINSVLTLVLIGHYDVKVPAIFAMLGTTFGLGALCLLLAAGMGANGAVLTPAVPAAILLVVNIVRLRRLDLGDSGDGQAHEPVNPWRVIRFSAPYFAAQILNTIIGTQSENVALARYDTTTHTGFYNLGYTLPARLLSFIPLVVMNVAGISLNELYVSDRSRFYSAITTFYKMLFFLVAPLSLLGAAIARPAFVVLYGPEQSTAGTIAVIFFIAYSLGFLAMPFGFVERATERTWISPVLAAPQAAFNIALIFILIPRFGLAGAVASGSVTLVVASLSTLWMWSRVFREVQIPWRYIAKCYACASLFLLLLPIHAATGLSPLLLTGIGATGLLWLLAIRAVGLVGPEQARYLLRSGLPLRRLVTALIAPGVA